MSVQFETAAEKCHDWNAAEALHGLCLDLIQTLTPENSPSLQEAMKIRFLHAKLNYNGDQNPPVSLSGFQLSCRLVVLSLKCRLNRI